MKTSFLKKGIALSMIVLTVIISTAFIPKETNADYRNTRHFIILCEKGDKYYISDIIDYPTNDIHDDCFAMHEDAMVSFQNYLKAEYNIIGRLWIARYGDLTTSQKKRDLLYKEYGEEEYIKTGFTYSCN